jgi:hypothetical protein
VPGDVSVAHNRQGIWSKAVAVKLNGVAVVAPDGFGTMSVVPSLDAAVLHGRVARTSLTFEYNSESFRGTDSSTSCVLVSPTNVVTESGERLELVFTESRPRNV